MNGRDTKLIIALVKMEAESEPMPILDNNTSAPDSCNIFGVKLRTALMPPNYGRNTAINLVTNQRAFIVNENKALFCNV